MQNWLNRWQKNKSYSTATPQRNDFQEIETLLDYLEYIKALPPLQTRIIIVALCIKSCKILERNQ